MKFRLSTLGLAISFCSLFPLMGFVIQGAHNQGKTSAEIGQRKELTQTYLKQVKEDINNGLAWQIELSKGEGLKVRDKLSEKVYDGSKIGPRTVVVTTNNQIVRVDQKTGMVLEVFSKEQVNRKEE